MGLPQAPAPPHLYPQQLQLKLYQAFIFSIPILFSIILFLLFYLFYLKRRASSISSPPHIIPGSSNQATPYHASSVRPLSISLSHAPNARRKENKKKAAKEEHFFLLCCAFGIELYTMVSWFSVQHFSHHLNIFLILFLVSNDYIFRFVRLF